MTCSSCKNLNTKKKSDGAAGGCRYECKKLKCAVGGDMEACEKYQKDIMRDNDTCNKLYHEGLEFDDDPHSGSFYLIISAVLIVVLIIVYLTNPELFGR